MESVITKVLTDFSGSIELQTTISKNIDRLVNTGFELDFRFIEDLASGKYWELPSFFSPNRRPEEMHRRLNIEPEFKDSRFGAWACPFQWAIYLPLILLLTKLTRLKTASKEKDQSENLVDLVGRLTAFFQKETGKIVYAGTYGTKIYFRNIYGDEVRCQGNEKGHYYTNPHNGLYLTSDSIYCPDCRTKDEIRDAETAEARHMALEADSEAQDLITENIRRQEEERTSKMLTSRTKFHELIQESKFAEACSMIEEEEFRTTSEFWDISLEVVKKLQENKQDLSVCMIIFYHLLYSEVRVEIGNPNAFILLINLLKEFWRERFSKLNLKELPRRIDLLVQFSRKIKYLFINSDYFQKIANGADILNLQNAWKSFLQYFFLQSIRRINVLFVYGIREIEGEIRSIFQILGELDSFK